MSSLPNNIIFERIFFLGYHAVIVVLTVFGLNYLSLPQPDVSLALKKMMSMDETQALFEKAKLDTPVIESITGNVRVFEDQFSGSEREALENDHLKSGFTIETKAKSSALINLGHDRQVTIRVLPGTIIKFDEIKASKINGQQNSEMTLMSLIQGQIISKSSIPDNVIVDIRTRMARFSLHSSLSAIATDGTSFCLMVVKDGNVRAENSKTLKFDIVHAKNSFYVNREGTERRSELPGPLKFFEWDAKLEDLVDGRFYS